LGILDLDSYYHNRVLRWAGHVARIPMNWAPRQLLTGWGGALTANWVPRDEFRPRAQESAETQRSPHRLRNVKRHRPRQATVAAADPLYAHAKPSDAQPCDAQPSDAQPSDVQPSDAQPASCQPQPPSSRLREPCPCHAETRAADRAARYASRTNRANAPP
jgi:hypothetical protein